MYCLGDNSLGVAGLRTAEVSWVEECGERALLGADVEKLVSDEGASGSQFLSSQG